MGIGAGWLKRGGAAQPVRAGAGAPSCPSDPPPIFQPPAALVSRAHARIPHLVPRQPSHLQPAAFGAPSRGPPPPRFPAPRAHHRSISSTAGQISSG